jgi:sulfur relay (sulfurtransferase) complex TusBCD TusD component (DsrE family)
MERHDLLWFLVRHDLRAGLCTMVSLRRGVTQPRTSQTGRPRKKSFDIGPLASCFGVLS